MRGLLEAETEGRSEDAMTELVLVNGVIDVRYPARGEGMTEILTEPTELAAVREALAARGVRIRSMVLGADPKTFVRFENDDDARAALALLDALEDHEDVQRVSSNADFDLAQLEALA